jgi:3',5'-cyclic AMP phosphodiesterase CpdA
LSEPRKLKLFHVSDVHFGAEDPAAIAWFSELVTVEQPDAVIMTGDLTMRATKDEFQRGGDWLRSLGVPVTLEATTTSPITGTRSAACSRPISATRRSRR